MGNYLTSEDSRDLLETWLCDTMLWGDMTEIRGQERRGEQRRGVESGHCFLPFERIDTR